MIRSVTQFPYLKLYKAESHFVDYWNCVKFLFFNFIVVDFCYIKKKKKIPTACKVVSNFSNRVWTLNVKQIKLIRTHAFIYHFYFILIDTKHAILAHIFFFMHVDIKSKMKCFWWMKQWSNGKIFTFNLDIEGLNLTK